jgi:hypothetical protein
LVRKPRWRHLRQSGLAPQLEEFKSGRNPGRFQTAVQDLVGRTETPIGQASWSKTLVRQAPDARLALAAVLGVPTEDIRMRESAGQHTRP